MRLTFLQKICSIHLANACKNCFEEGKIVLCSHFNRSKGLSKIVKQYIKLRTESAKRHKVEGKKTQGGMEGCSLWKQKKEQV